jgi:hypothetical protein
MQDVREKSKREDGGERTAKEQRAKGMEQKSYATPET